MSRTGKLLIAHPNLPQGHWFKKSVIYIYSDNEEGTMGLMLNVPSTLLIKDLFEHKDETFHDEKSKVRIGGPVNTSAVILLHTNDWASDNTVSAGSHYNITSDVNMFHRLSIGDEPRFWRVMMGTCSWGPGQLDSEMNGDPPYKSEHSWLLAEANNSIIFENDYEDQWLNAVELCKKQTIDYYFTG